MQRYNEFTEIINTPEGRRRFSTLYYPKIEKKTSDIYITTKLMTRLDLLAAEYYGDVRYWPIISKANNLNQPTLRIPTGTRLRIPFPLNPGDIEEEFINKNL
jgi:hypothetical protein